MKSNFKDASVCTGSSEATVCPHDCISLPPHTVTKGIMRNLLPGNGRRRQYLKVHIHLSLKSASLSWKPSPIAGVRGIDSSRLSHAVQVSSYLFVHTNFDSLEC